MKQTVNEPYRFKDKFMVAVSGSRSISDYEAVKSEIYYLLDLLEEGGIISSKVAFVTGGAKGVDSMVKQLVEEHNDFPLVEILPDYKKYGRSAPIIRNQAIVDSCDVLIAFPNNDSKGTMNTVKTAQRKGIPTIIIPFKDGKKLSDRKLTKHWEKFMEDFGLVPKTKGS